jgi:alkylation response protein AidB-like acyl-CoA dehydrogenase
VDLTLSADQEMLVDAARRFLTRSWPAEAVRAVEASPDGHDPKAWSEAAGMGWPGLCLPAEHGGSGAGMVELALLAEELGRAAFGSPLLSQTTLVALPLAWEGTAAQRDRWLPALAAGELIGSAALIGPGARDEGSSPPLAGRRSADRWELTGSRVLVPFAGVSSVLTVLADLEGAGPSMLVVEAERAAAPARQHALGGDPMYAVCFDGAAVGAGDVIGRPGSGAALLARALDHAAVASVAYGVGLGERALELSVSHASDRHQFGRPIGSFQAVAHRCVDMRADLDASRWLARQAAWALDKSAATGGLAGPTGGLEVAAAKAYANDALRRVFLNAHQVHGAIGFSLEHDLQLFTRRAKAFELSLGDTAHHRRRVAEAMGLGRSG